MDHDGDRPWNRPRRGLFAMDLLYVKNLLKYLGSVLSSDRDDSAQIETLGNALIEYHLRRISIYLIRVFGPTVQSGPFKGMSLVPEAPSSVLSPKILGTYELEILAAIQTRERYDRLVNIGSGEGYFAVGCLLADTDLTTIAFDTLAKARDLTSKLAVLNKTSDRLEVRAACDSATLMGLARPGSLFLIDIEGGERELFQSVPAESLAAADFLIETHWVNSQSTCEFLIDYFSRTHEVEIIPQQARDPSMFPELMELDQIDRILALWEARGSDPWLNAKSVA